MSDSVVGLGFGCGSIPRLRYYYDRPVPEKRYFCRDLVRYFGKGFGKVRLMVLGLMLSKRAHINFAESDTPYRESARQLREKRSKIRAKNSNSIQIQITLGHW